MNAKDKIITFWIFIFFILAEICLAVYFIGDFENEIWFIIGHYVAAVLGLFLLAVLGISSGA